MSLSSELRRVAIVLCILFGVEHDERYDSLIQIISRIGILLRLSEQQIDDMKSSCVTFYLMILSTLSEQLFVDTSHVGEQSLWILSTTSATTPQSKLCYGL